MMCASGVRHEKTVNTTVHVECRSEFDSIGLVPEGQFRFQIAGQAKLRVPFLHGLQFLQVRPLTNNHGLGLEKSNF